MNMLVSGLIKKGVLFSLGLLLLCVSHSPAWSGSITLNGGGASFPAPLYNQWFKYYHRIYPDERINYQEMGSGAGVKSFTHQRLDFAGSDVPMTPQEIAKVENGVVQAPLTAGAVVFIYNLRGVRGLRLSREAYTGIFLGKIRNWRDPLIASQNQGIDLPDKEIYIIARAESSGTTYVLSEHLSAVNETFAQSVGVSKTPVWPANIAEEGRLIKTLGNGNVARMVQMLPGSMGYVEYSYAFFNNIAMAALQNKAGDYVLPTPHSFLASMATAIQEEGAIYKLAPDPVEKGSYPIMSLSWFCCNRSYSDPLKLKTIQKVLKYCLIEGQKENLKLGYVPLIDPILSEALERVDEIKLKP